MKVNGSMTDNMDTVGPTLEVLEVLCFYVAVSGAFFCFKVWSIG